jgi:hypothetical protein
MTPALCRPGLVLFVGHLLHPFLDHETGTERLHEASRTTATLKEWTRERAAPMGPDAEQPRQSASLLSKRLG